MVCMLRCVHVNNVPKENMQRAYRSQLEEWTNTHITDWYDHYQFIFLLFFFWWGGQTEEVNLALKTYIYELLNGIVILELLEHCILL